MDEQTAKLRDWARLRGASVTIRSDKPSKPPSTERRPKRRKRVLWAGIITYADGAYCFDCTIRDVSETGARVTIGKNAQFPSDFYLINIHDCIAYDAKVVWNDGSDIGVSFKRSFPLSKITNPSLSYLKRLWLSKAAR
jgi:hypothetical protein